MSRVYLPTTLEGLRTLVEVGTIELRGGVVAESELEDDEYAAMLAAADVSQSLLTAPGRRVVVVLDSAAQGPIPISLVAAIHADTEPIAPQENDPPELAWFAVQEISDLLA